jgi:hypothetical protein
MSSSPPHDPPSEPADDVRDEPERDAEQEPTPAGELPAGAEDAPVSLSGKAPKPGATRPPPTRAGATQGPPSVIQILASRTGVAPQVLLRDEDSAHGVSPVLQGSADGSQPVPARGGSYQLLGEIARGGMGVVLKGHDGDLGRDVAMKVLLEKHAGNPAIVQRFVEEAQIGGQLQYPGIVPVYGLGLMEDERPYFTMKLVKGRTLAAAARVPSAASRQRAREPGPGSSAEVRGPTRP